MCMRMWCGYVNDVLSIGVYNRGITHSHIGGPRIMAIGKTQQEILAYLLNPIEFRVKVGPLKRAGIPAFPLCISVDRELKAARALQELGLVKIFKTNGYWAYPSYHVIALRDASEVSKLEDFKEMHVMEHGEDLREA